MDRRIARTRRARSWELPRFREDNVPHHRLGPFSVLSLFPQSSAPKQAVKSPVGKKGRLVESVPHCCDPARSCCRLPHVAVGASACSARATSFMWWRNNLKTSRTCSAVSGPGSGRSRSRLVPAMVPRIRMDLTRVGQAPAKKLQRQWAPREYWCQPKAFGNGLAARP